jgi:hypothetical protein
MTLDFGNGSRGISNEMEDVDWMNDVSEEINCSETNETVPKEGMVPFRHRNWMVIAPFPKK